MTLPQPNLPTISAPRTLGVITFLVIPAGWLLGIVNFYRLGLKQKAFWHGMALLFGSFLALGLAFFGGSGPTPLSLSFLVALAAGYYMGTETHQEIRALEKIGQTISYATWEKSIMEGLVCWVVWYGFLLGLVLMGAILVFLVSGVFNPVLPSPFPFGQISL